MKKSVYALFLCCVLMMFSGCGQVSAQTNNDVFEKNAFRIVRKIDKDERIFLSYIFPANTDFMMQNFSDEEVATYKFYLMVYTNALATSNREKSFDKMTVSKCLYFEDIDGIGFTICFEDLAAQNKFFGAGESDKNDDDTTKELTGFFVKKLTIKTVFPVSSTNAAGELKMLNILAISSWAKQCDISTQKKDAVLEKLNSAKYIYDFASTQEGLKSELMYRENGFVHNVFCKDITEIKKDNTISFYIQSVNKGLIYIFCLVFVLIATAIALFIVIKREKKQEKY
ncbi:MAG: hypothetical protein IJ817_04125 [Clostridia bacterium]|nr:hypothetical protein [Clostridia bacterium]